MKVVWPALAVIVVILGLSLILAHASCAKPNVELVQPNVVESSANPQLYVAVRKAKNTLKDFIARYQSPHADDKGFGVQTAFDSPKGPEHIWVHLDKYADGVFTGRLADEPAAVPGLHKGETVHVKKDDVTDWIYESGQTKEGGFTLDALQGQGG